MRYRIGLSLLGVVFCLLVPYRQILNAATVTHGVAVADTTSCDGSPNTVAGTLTPAANDLLVVFVVVASETDAGSISDDQGGTYTEIRTQVFATGADKIWAYVRTSLAANVSHIVTFDSGAGDLGAGCGMFIVRVAGMTRTGSSAVRQSAGDSNQAGGGTPVVSAFASAALTGNPTLAFVANGTNPATMTPPVGWTEDAAGDTGFATPTTGLEYVFRNSGFTGTAITYGGTSASGFANIALEMDTSAASSPAGGGLTLVGAGD